jgi:Flp pilus assembly protein CpaB
LRPLPALGVVLVFIALIGYWATYNASSHRTQVLITAQAIPPGGAITPADLRTADLSGDGTVIAGIEPASDLHRVVGQRIESGLPAGTPLTRTALAPAPASTSAFTLTVSALHALGGALEPGDHVTVLVTFGAGTGQARTRPIARGLQILSVGAIPTGEESSTATVPVTVALPDPSIVSDLAIANEDGKIDLLREGAGASTAPIQPATDAGGGQ